MDFRLFVKKVAPPFLFRILKKKVDNYRTIRGFYRVHDRYSTSESSTVNIIKALKNFFFPETIILFYPEYPAGAQVAYKLSVLLGYGFSNSLANSFDVVFRQEDSTHSDEDVGKQASVKQHHVVNSGVYDISKGRVGTVFSKVFGYDLQVNPVLYHGSVVEKSDENYRHDGRTIEAPLSPRAVKKEKVYQREVDNSLLRKGRSMVVDHRVVVHGSEIPLIYLKYRPFETRFSNENASAEIAKPEQEFSRDELETLIQFAHEMGADYCEMDVLRDNKNGKIYVVDLNVTPAGPPNGLIQSDQLMALNLLKPSFKRMIEGRCL